MASFLEPKAYGHRIRHHGVTIRDIPGRMIPFRILYPCTRETCPNVESNFSVFLRCSNCLTIYCTSQCAILDWNGGKHKEYCKSGAAYESQKNAWEETLPNDVSVGTKAYTLAHRKWMSTPKMQSVLRTVGAVDDASTS